MDAMNVNGVSGRGDVERVEGKPAALPWEWFEFAPGGGKGAGAGADGDGGVRVITAGVEVDGRRVPYRVLRREDGGGARRALVLLHGMGLNIGTFRSVAPYLLGAHDLVMIDYSSFSAVKEWPSGGVSIKVMSEAVWRVADALKLGRVSLGGNSLGGGMCLIAALSQGERVERMVLMNPACYPQRLPLMYRLSRVPMVGEKFVNGVERIGYVDKGRFDEELRRRYVVQMSQRESRVRLMDTIRQLPGHSGDLSAALHLGRLGEIVVPTLLLWGKQDPLLAAESGLRLARELGNCRLVEFAGLAHMPHEEAPEVVGPLMADFLRG